MPGIAGQTDQIMPGQQGTIPERVEGPRGSQERGSLTASADDVKKAKEALKAQGHNPGTIDGNMDDRTQQALRDFQQANKLPVTGMLDQQTAAKLGLTLKSGSSTPQRGRDGVSPQGDKSPIPGRRAVE
jgi:peptidoglycan hydrolase-like protein with peptidoglycan-binding domain